jgi:hypothetical protein
MYQTCVYASLAVLCAVLPWVRARKDKRIGPLPPSPKSDPLIGHLRYLAQISDEPTAYRD